MSTDTPRTDAAQYDTGLRLDSYDENPDWVVAASFATTLERELASVTEERDSLKQSLERLLNAEQQRLLLTSEEQIRREILADGRDPDEYLRAINSSMKCTTEKVILEHDLKAAEQQLHANIFLAILALLLLFALAFTLALQNIELKQTIATLTAQCSEVKP